MVGTLVVAAAAGTTAAGVAASFALTAAAMAVNFAVSMIVSRVFGQSGQGPQDSGTREQVPPSSVNAIPVVYGDAYLGGTFVDAVLTTDQRTMYYVIAVSCISPNGQFTFDLKKFYYGDRLVTFSASGSVNSVDIEKGGTGYAVGNVLTIQGGTPTTATQLTVTQVSSGRITAVSITNAGSYAYGLTPNNPATVTGGSGTGATFVLGYTSYGPTVQALTDEAGNIDTKINNSTSLQISLYTSNNAGVITRLNTTDFPSTVMGGADIDAALRWPASGRQMNGLAFAIVRLFYNQDAGTTNLSPITFYAKHYLNGTGVAKPGDVWYDYITNPAYGGAVDPAFVNASSATALNTYSDQIITYTPSGGGSATQARYRTNGVIDAGQTVLSNLDKIMTCADSWMAYNAALGQWSIVINKAETTAYAFDDDNIIGEVRVSATDITQSVNKIEAKFPDKNSRDQPNFVNIETPVGLLYPNEPVNKYSVTYDLCNDSVQAQYLANRILEQAREDLIVSFSTTYYGIQVDAGDVVSVTNSDYGWTNKLFRVVKVNEASLPDGSLGAKLEMTEYSAAVYDDFDITQYVPVPNSNIPSPVYFSALAAPVIIASRPSDPVPTFDIRVFVPTSGRVTFGVLYYTTSVTPGPFDWKIIANAQSSAGTAAVNGSAYVWPNLSLPSGNYYFAFVVGNEIGQSALSPITSAFTWSPVGTTGPEGPTGPRSSSGYIYYATSQATAPAAPTASGFNYDTGLFSSLTAGWSTTFTAPDPVTNASTEAGSKFWAVRYNVSEATYGGSESVTLSAVFNWQNFDGLVTFTNISAPSGVTFIDGGNIITDTITVGTLKSNSSGTFNNFATFGLGTTTSAAGWLSAATFTSSNINYSGAVAVNTGAGPAIVAATTSTVATRSAIVGFGAANSTVTTYQNLGALGSGNGAGIFQTAGAGNLAASAPTADIRLSFYTGGTSYAYYIYSGASFPFTAGHDALQLLTEPVPEIGDFMVDVALIASPTVNDVITEMAVSTSANQKGIIGVFVGVTGEGFVPAALGEYVEVDGVQTMQLKPEYANIYETYRCIGVNAIGEGKLNVCGQNGNIEIGDLICASDMAGKGMKQSDDLFHSYTVAKSRENVIFDSPTDVKQIACIYMGG